MVVKAMVTTKVLVNRKGNSIVGGFLAYKHRRAHSSQERKGKGASRGQGLGTRGPSNKRKLRKLTQALEGP